MPDRELEGRVALVTGGSRGIGAAVCAELGAAGAEVVVNYASSADAAEQVCAAVRAAGGTAHAVAGDVSTPEGAAGLVAHVESEVGPIAILVCNAGITRDNLIMKLSDDDWRVGDRHEPGRGVLHLPGGRAADAQAPRRRDRRR